ncbi:unnamed protein product [Sphagnum troendelagicum]|uniref:Uncharacterized protein n=1 Tax=Sphagnum troendelagicum TaxID=128251 RepID=A0ABP0TUP0_9BRYO
MPVVAHALGHAGEERSAKKLVGVTACGQEPGQLQPGLGPEPEPELEFLGNGLGLEHLSKCLGSGMDIILLMSPHKLVVISSKSGPRESHRCHVHNSSDKEAFLIPNLLLILSHALALPNA